MINDEDSTLIQRCASLLNYMNESETHALLVATGVSSDQAHLYIQAGAMLLKDRIKGFNRDDR